MSDEASRKSSRYFYFVVAYVFVVLGVDTLAAQDVGWPFAWGVFDWSGASFYKWAVEAGFAREDVAWLQHPLVRPFWLFKFLFWFVIPVAICWRGMDWGWFGLARLKKVDGIILGVGAVAGIAVLFLIPLIPGLREFYPDLSHLSEGQKWNVFVMQLSRTFSWLLGWEFIHRYWLLRVAREAHPRWGWIVVPVSEMAYHLQKHPLEMLGMGLFSVVATRWTLKRENMVLPFLVHLAIELGLVVYMLFGG